MPCQRGCDLCVGVVILRAPPARAVPMPALVAMFYTEILAGCGGAGQGQCGAEREGGRVESRKIECARVVNPEGGLLKQRRVLFFSK